MAQQAVAVRGVSIALACRAFAISQRCYRYAPLLADENEEIEDWLIALTKAQKNWGFGLCYLYLRNVKGFGVNHKRVRPLVDRQLQSNLPRGGFTANWS
jgi:putative transposase